MDMEGIGLLKEIQGHRVWHCHHYCSRDNSDRQCPRCDEEVLWGMSLVALDGGEPLGDVGAPQDARQRGTGRPVVGLVRCQTDLRGGVQ